MNRLGKNVLYIVARSHWFNIKCVEDYANVKVNRMIWERVETPVWNIIWDTLRFRIEKESRLSN